MFPYISLFTAYRHYLIGFIFLTLVGYQTSQLLNPPNRSVHTDDPRLADVIAHEELLTQKAFLVLQRFGVSSSTIDLSVALDHTTITTTTFDPGPPKAECRYGSVPGTWREETSSAPRITNIKVCVTVPASHKIDQDQLFRGLSYALGIDLSRGDILRLVFL